MPCMVAAAPFLGLYGRHAELSELVQALDRAASGRLAVVVIEGEPGIGKTRLLAETLRQARDRGMQIVAGRAEELERTRPFGAVTDAFGCVDSSSDPRRVALAALLGTHIGGDRGPIAVSTDPGLQFRAIDAFSDLAEELALVATLVIGLDDIQWADPSSLLTVGALCRRLADLPVAIIVCLRPAPRDPPLPRALEALEGFGARHLMLSGLTASAVSDLVAGKLDARPGPELLSQLAAATGNPLFVTELLGALLQDGSLANVGTRHEVSKFTLPPTLRLTILRRVSFLSEKTLQALRFASILGTSFRLTDLSVTTDCSAIALSLAMAEAIQAGVLDEEGVRLRFHHDLIRDAIYQDMPASVRLALHREAGQRLADSGAAVQRVAEQFARGAVPGDTEATGWLVKAAREVAPSSPDAAADLLERAIGLIDSQDPRRDPLLAERAQGLMLAGRIAESEALCRSLLSGNRDLHSTRLARVCLGQVLLAQGRPRECLTVLEEDAPAILSGNKFPVAQAWAGFAQLTAGDLARAATLAGQARAAAAAADDHIATSISMVTLGVISEFGGRLDEAVQICDDAVRLADESPGRVGHRYPVHVTRGRILTELDQLANARATLEAGRRISEELGARWPLATYQAYTGFERYTAGAWDDAVVELEGSIAIAEETGETYCLVLAHDLLSQIKLHRNDLQGGEEAVAVAERLARTSPTFYLSRTSWVRALLLEAAGQTAEAYETLATGWEHGISSHVVTEHPLLGADLVRLAVAVGDARRAREVAAAVADVAAMNKVPSLTGAAQRCQGLVANDAEMLSDAVDSYAQGPRPLELALACEDAGAALAQQDQAVRARRLLDQALAIYEHLDAARDLARANATIRDLGIRRGRRGPRRRPQYGWPSLTSTERTITDLVAQGLTNPQIGDRLYVSRRTVQTHLAHIFVKLDLSSRAQLAAEVARLRPQIESIASSPTR